MNFLEHNLTVFSLNATINNHASLGNMRYTSSCLGCSTYFFFLILGYIIIITSTRRTNFTLARSKYKRVPSECRAPCMDSVKKKTIFSLGLVPKCMFQTLKWLLSFKHLVSSLFFHFTKVLNLLSLSSYLEGHLIILSQLFTFKSLNISISI